MFFQRNKKDNLATSQFGAQNEENDKSSKNMGEYDSEDGGLFLLGPESSGKTVYMTTAIARLKEILPKEYGCTFSACNADVEASYEKYYKKLYQEHMLPDPTKEQARLSYEVESMYTREITRVTFSDIDGKISASPREFFSDSKIFQTAAHSNFFLVTLDIRKMMEDDAQRLAAEDIFPFVIPTIIGKEREKKYLAIVLTKSDELWGEFGAQSLIYQPVKYSNAGFDEQRAKINEMLREYMMIRYLGIVMQAEHCFDEGHVNYFAVSALGRPPERSGKVAGVINPIRVEEPVLWLLKKSGIFDNG